MLVCGSDLIPDKMCVRHLGFVLLLWFPGALSAQHKSCPAPILDGGYFIPEQKTYAHTNQLIYACDNGHKPAVEGWWVTTTCQNGKWSHKPQCIDENSCFPPNIPNAKYRENPNGWYKNGDTIRITCDKGYTSKSHNAIARCINATWSSVPICEKSIWACSAPPKIPHAVIINQSYQEVFTTDSEVQYECEDGYSAAGDPSEKSMWCIVGNWNIGSTCKSSTSSGTEERETEPPIITKTSVDNCGKHPNIQNGDVVETNPMFLKYQCNLHYTRVGPEKVMCYSNGKWSQVPTCKGLYCTVNTDSNQDLKPAGVKYINHGETEYLDCVDRWRMDNYAVAKCNFGKPSLSRCCNWAQIKTNLC
uniref:Sushi domain-containing protein n=1 Tax=Monopterus albus TaxID=43700 RepID=A0A3Q3J4Q7_MONAL|nr:complement factor H-like [Monopterus albus]